MLIQEVLHHLEIKNVQNRALLRKWVSQITVELRTVAADSRGRGGQLPTLGKKKVGKTMFLPTYLLTSGVPLAAGTASNEFCLAGHFQRRRSHSGKGGKLLPFCKQGVALLPFARKCR